MKPINQKFGGSRSPPRNSLPDPGSSPQRIVPALAALFFAAAAWWARGALSAIHPLAVVLTQVLGVGLVAVFLVLLARWLSERMGAFSASRPSPVGSGVAPTRVGVAATALTLLIFAAAINTGTNLLYLVVSMLLSLGVVSIGFGWPNLRRIKVIRRVPANVFAGQTAEIIFVLTNEDRWSTRYGIGAEEIGADLGSDPIAAFFLSIGPGRSLSRAIAVRFPRRGLYRLDRVILHSSFPFGFIHFSARHRLHSEVLVYPRLVPVAHVLRRRGAELGTSEANAKGHGVSLFSIRDYQPGDSAKSIHWKLSAKGVGLKVREYEREDKREVRVVLDFRATPDPSDEQIDLFERTVSLAASVAKFFIDLDYEVSFWSAAGTVDAGAGPAQLAAIMRALALVDQASFVGAVEPPAAAPSDAVEIRITPSLGSAEGPAAAASRAGPIRIDLSAVAAEAREQEVHA